MKELFAVKLLQLRKDFLSVRSALVIGQLGLVLLPLDVFLSDDLLGSLLRNLLGELFVPLVKLSILHDPGALCHSVHLAVSILGKFDFHLNMLLLGLFRRLHLIVDLLDHVPHLFFMSFLILLLVPDDHLALLSLLLIFHLHICNAVSVNKL